MSKTKFYKNLYQSISYFSIIMVFEIVILIGFFTSLNYESNSGWILLILSIVLIVLYFIVGWYWIFQKVYIDHNGIKIVLFNKTLRENKWEDIKNIEEATIMRNPALKIKFIDGSEIHLDNRKSIIKTIEKYIQKNIE